MKKVSLFFLCFLLFDGVILAQANKKTPQLHTYEFKKMKSAPIPEIAKLMPLIEKTYIEALPKSKESYNFQLPFWNKAMKTKVFKKVIQVSMLSVSPKDKKNKKVSFELEEFVFSDAKHARTAFEKYKVYAAQQLASKEPKIGFLFLKNDRLIRLMGKEDLYKSPFLQNYYKKMIISQLFNNKEGEILEIN